MTMKHEPPRGPLAPDVEKAARMIHCEVWSGPYQPGRGPMHFAGGTYWHDELLRRADKWEAMAVAARVCASTLPGSRS
jgi:hypothetical protein